MFQQLPPEIRLKIYRNLSPISTSCTAEWTGLLLSCKLVYHEMQHELLRVMTRYLKHIETDWMKTYNVPLKISTLSTIAEIGTVSVAIPNSYFRAQRLRFPASRKFSAIFMALLGLGISRLKFTRYEDDASIQDPEATVTDSIIKNALSDFLRNLMIVIDSSEDSSQIQLDDDQERSLVQESYIKSVAFEWGTFDQEVNHGDFIFRHYAAYHGPDRTLKLVREHICGPTTGAVWRRPKYTWYGQKLEKFWAEAK